MGPAVSISASLLVTVTLAQVENHPSRLRTADSLINASTCDWLKTTPFFLA